MAVAGVGELVVGRGELLEALCSDGGEVAFEICELDEDHRASSDEAVDQRLLRHFFRTLNPRFGSIRSEDFNGAVARK